MSKCVSAYKFNKNQMIVAADSRASYEHEGKKYTIHDRAKKLQVVHNKLIFICGTQVICQKAIDYFTQSADGSISSFRNIAKRVVKNECDNAGIKDGTGMYLCNFTVFTFDKQMNKPVAYNFHSERHYNGDAPFTIRSFTDYTHWINGRSHTKPDEYLQANINKTNHKVSLIKKVFDMSTDYGVGGQLSVYTVGKDGIKLIKKYNLSDEGKSIEWMDEQKVIESIGQFDWGNGKVLSDPLAVNANNKANDAYVLAGDAERISKMIANGTYTQGSFISGTMISSPLIMGAIIEGGQIRSHTTINVGTDLSVGDNIYLSNGTSGKQSIVSGGNGNITFGRSRMEIAANNALNIDTGAVYIRDEKIATEKYVDDKSIARFG
ncbi:hypothetical protein ACFSTH_11810 [Paenibacillus yanchengensis]|uniref:Uncharacterized protein n=1 Tax=Paenibacillus yanchengensis TaxID=2035833 RepID=A0ABW4YR26_9BACL